MTAIDFTLRGDWIALDALLKATGLVASGGEAKQVIVGAQVHVDGRVETRRAAKLRPGQVVTLAGLQVKLCPAIDSDP